MKGWPSGYFVRRKIHLTKNKYIDTLLLGRLLLRSLSRNNALPCVIHGLIGLGQNLLGTCHAPGGGN